MSEIILYVIIFFGIFSAGITAVLLHKRKVRQIQFKSKILTTQSEPIFWTELQENHFR